MTHVIKRIEQENGTAKFGRNSAVGLAVEDVWNLGGTKAWPTVAATLYISSTNQAADVGIEITVDYIDASGLEATVTGTLHATDARTFVSLGVTGLDVNRAYVSGDGETLTGTVYVSNDNTDVGGDGIPDTIANALATIPPVDNQTLQCTYRMPLNRHGHILNWGFSTNATNAAHSVICRLQIKPPSGSWRTQEIAGAELGKSFSKEFPLAIRVEAGSQIRITSISTVASADVSAWFTLAKSLGNGS